MLLKLILVIPTCVLKNIFQLDVEVSEQDTTVLIQVQDTKQDIGVVANGKNH